MSANRETFTIIVLMLLPVMCFIFLKKPVNKWLRKKAYPIRFVDLMSPLLIYLSHILSSIIVGRSFLPYFLVIVSACGLIIFIVNYRKQDDIPIAKSLKIWWRLLDLLAIAMFLLVIICYVVRLFIK